MSEEYRFVHCFIQERPNAYMNSISEKSLGEKGLKSQFSGIII